MYPTDTIYESIFYFTETEAMNESFDLLGYSSLNFISLSGSLLINLIIGIVKSLLLVCIQKICVAYYENKLAEKIGKNLLSFENIKSTLLRLFIEGYLEINISCLIAIFNFDFKGSNHTGSDVIAIVLALSLLIFLILIPIYISYLVVSNRKIIHEKDFQKKYSMFLDGLDINNIDQSSTNGQVLLRTLYHSFFMLRRAVIAFILVFFNKNPNL
jgi:hypothetical protein